MPLAKDKNLFESVNIFGNENILKAASFQKLIKLIYTSSNRFDICVPETNPVVENMPKLLKPMESYGFKVYWRCHIKFISENLDVIIIRPRTILGHGRLGIFPNFI